MFDVIVDLHSILRWIVIVTGLIAVGRAVAGWGGRVWTSGDARAGLFYMIALDVQLLLGLLLYLFLSPTVRIAFTNIGAAMRDSSLRFFVVEHAFGMLIAITLAHIGRIRVRKAASDTQRHRSAAVFFGLSLFIVLLSIPWPGMSAGRPLWPW